MASLLLFATAALSCAQNGAKDFASSLLPSDRKSTRLISSHGYISYAVFCLKKKKTHEQAPKARPPVPARRRGHPLPQPEEGPVQVRMQPSRQRLHPRIALPPNGQRAQLPQPISTYDRYPQYRCTQRPTPPTPTETPTVSPAGTAPPPSITKSPAEEMTRGTPRRPPSPPTPSSTPTQ